MIVTRWKLPFAKWHKKNKSQRTKGEANKPNKQRIILSLPLVWFFYYLQRPSPSSSSFLSLSFSPCFWEHTPTFFRKGYESVKKFFFFWQFLAERVLLAFSHFRTHTTHARKTRHYFSVSDPKMRFPLSLSLS